jgi:hypothetical protein
MDPSGVEYMLTLVECSLECIRHIALPHAEGRVTHRHDKSDHQACSNGRFWRCTLPSRLHLMAAPDPADMGAGFSLAPPRTCVCGCRASRGSGLADGRAAKLTLANRNRSL